IAAAVESYSSHPAAKAIVSYVGKQAVSYMATSVEEIRGFGVRGQVNGKDVIAGNLRLLQQHSISTTPDLAMETGTMVYVAIDKILAGAIVISDEIKEDAKATIDQLHR